MAAILDLIEPEIAPLTRRHRKSYFRPRTKHEVDRMTRCEDVQIRPITRSAFGNSHFEGREVVGESLIVPLERAMLVSYTLYIVTIELSLTVRPQFAIECLRRSNQQGVGVGQFGSKF